MVRFPAAVKKYDIFPDGKRKFLIAMMQHKEEKRSWFKSSSTVIATLVRVMEITTQD